MSPPRLSATEAAARLGVKRETLYAYVSRGLLGRERGPDGRSSTFAADEVAALAERARRGGRSAGLEVVVASAITLLGADTLAFRGLDAVALAGRAGFEAVAEWLWGAAEVPSTRPGWPPVTTPATLVTLAGTGGGWGPLDRFRVALAGLGAADELRYDLDRDAVAAAGRRIITTLVGSLPVAAVPVGATPVGRGRGAAGPVAPGPDRPDPAGGVASALWARLSGRPAETAAVAALDAALVLLADHELAASTFAVRVAASVRADPYSVVATGLGVIAGTLHGAASQEVVRLFEEVGRPARAARVVGEHLRRGERVAGTGHAVYQAADPRAEALLLRLAAVPADPDRRLVVEEVLAVVRARSHRVVNIDFALGALCWLADLGVDAGEAIFAVARTAGWLAHAMEEYGEAPLRFRPRAVYTGPRP